MQLWTKYLKKIPAPSLGVMLLDLAFLLLALFVSVSNISFLPGLRDVELPKMGGGEGMTFVRGRSLLLVIKVNQGRVLKNTELGGRQKGERSDESADGFTYFFQGAVQPTFAALEDALLKALEKLRKNLSWGEEPYLILCADRHVHYDELARCFQFAQKQGLRVFLMTARDND